MVSIFSPRSSERVSLRTPCTVIPLLSLPAAVIGSIVCNNKSNSLHIFLLVKNPSPASFAQMREYIFSEIYRYRLQSCHTEAHCNRKISHHNSIGRMVSLLIAKRLHLSTIVTAVVTSRLHSHGQIIGRRNAEINSGTRRGTIFFAF